MSPLIRLLWFCHLAAASLIITIPPSTLLSNPHILPATTHATLISFPSADEGHIKTAVLTQSSTLVFQDFPAGQPKSYLLDIHAGDFVFAPYRVDVAADGNILGVWETFRGNPWDNRGSEKYGIEIASKKSGDVAIEAKVIDQKRFYEERAKCEFYHYFS